MVGVPGCSGPVIVLGEPGIGIMPAAVASDIDIVRSVAACSGVVALQADDGTVRRCECVSVLQHAYHCPNLRVSDSLVTGREEDSEAEV